VPFRSELSCSFGRLPQNLGQRLAGLMDAEGYFGVKFLNYNLKIPQVQLEFSVTLNTRPLADFRVA
jgi:hypothetical protein